VSDQLADDRRAELAVALSEIHRRIRAACTSAGRDPADVRLLAVTKTFPARDVALLADLSVFDVAEARDQEAAQKVIQARELRPQAPLRWHMVGRLQRNKARSVARWAVQVQSVDSLRIADALDRAAWSAQQAGERDGPLGVLVQVSLDGDTSRGGVARSDLDGLADRLAAARALRLKGLMAVAPLGTEPGAAFADLADTAQWLRRRHPTAVELSAGMSRDLEQAIAHGSTCVRVGTALLGGRPIISP
jgi:pyridoxal phosphate enzyme (YggS family)